METAVLWPVMYSESTYLLEQGSCACVQSNEAALLCLVMHGCTAYLLPNSVGGRQHRDRDVQELSMHETGAWHTGLHGTYKGHTIDGLAKHASHSAVTWCS